MEAGIVRSIKEGFQATNRSWAGMGLYAAGWVLLGVLTFTMVSVMDIPPELIQQDASQSQTVSTDIDAVDQDALTPEEEEALQREQSRIAVEWLGRVWPVLLIWTLFVLAAAVLLVGGQIGYLAKRMQGEAAPLSIFWLSARKAFKPLLISWLIVLAASLGFTLLLVVIGLILSFLPAILSGFLGFVLIVALMVGLIWISVRVALWSIAIVAGGLAPIPALKASFHSIQKRWWKTLGLLLLLTLIAIGISIPISILGWIGGLAGGFVGASLDLISSILEFAVVNIYMGFVAMASLIRYYFDIGAASAEQTQQQVV